MISIVIVNYNTKDLLRECLASIAEHCPDAETIVVDNASRDGSAAVVAAEFPRVELVELPVNAGFAGANNVGIERAGRDFIVLLNSDTVLEDDSLSRCAGWMREHPEVGAASPLIFGMDGQTQPCSYRFPSLAESLRVAFRGRPRAASGDFDPDAWLVGTCLMIRREALAEAGGGLDDGYFMYWEDADFSATLRALGWSVARYSGGYIRHYGGASGGGSDSNRRGDLYAWNAFGRHRWFARHRPWWEAAGMWALDGIEAARKVVRGTLRSDRRYERAQARILAGVLLRRLVGLTPPRPAPPSACPERPSKAATHA